MSIGALFLIGLTVSLLNLDGNALPGPIPSDLARLSSTLRWLDSSYNSFTGTLPSELGQLSQLECLDLSYNLN